jgi:hypothetical protein
MDINTSVSRGLVKSKADLNSESDFTLDKKTLIPRNTQRLNTKNALLIIRARSKPSQDGNTIAGATITMADKKA